ncbi:hypothetical protein BG003_002738 [Podila horticola]|nr:hypothetical protein BG003_002738 [Podila horticola]
MIFVFITVNVNNPSNASIKFGKVIFLASTNIDEIGTVNVNDSASFQWVRRAFSIINGQNLFEFRDGLYSVGGTGSATLTFKAFQWQK